MFEVITGSGLFPALAGIFRTPQLALYEPSGSWFDPNRIVRLEAHDESLFVMLPKRLYSSYPIAGAEQYLPRLTYSFAKTMKLMVQVGAFEGQGGRIIVMSFELHACNLPVARLNGRPGPGA